MSELAISVQNITKSYQISSSGQALPTTLAEAVANVFKRGFRRPQKKQFQALQDVSLEVRRGEVLGIIGKNGSGKTTLLKILSRITEPTSGQIDLYGRVASLLEVGTGFHPELTGRENIYLNGAILGMSRQEIDAEFDSIIAFAETEAFLDTPVKRYSSGMYVRLAFAVAAHLNPDILIVDEVLAVGDIQFQRKSMDRMESAASKEGKTILFVSHNMAAVAKLCNRVVLLDRGIVRATGSPEAVIAEYMAGVSDENRPVTVIKAEELPAPFEDIVVRTFDSESRPSATFKLGEDWHVQLEFQVSSPVSHFIAAIGLQTLDSISITTIWSESAELGRGRYHVHFPCDLAISAGEVTLSIGLSSFERSLFYRPRALQIAISDLSDCDQPVRSSGCGCITNFQRPKVHRDR
jgi:homopolymeric O-antigen transport system ATP-binding protein